MELLIQKYIRYFYIVLIIILTIQLAMAVIGMVIYDGVFTEGFLLTFLSVLNISFLLTGLKFNLKQKFTECKLNLKILRITMIPLIFCQALFCFTRGFNFVMLMDYIGTLFLIELILSYRIKCIDHLENLATRMAKTERKGGRTCKDLIGGI